MPVLEQTNKQNNKAMEDRIREMYERSFINENYDSDKRSGCGPIMVSLLIIAAFWLIGGIIYLFT